MSNKTTWEAVRQRISEAYDLAVAIDAIDQLARIGILPAGEAFNAKVRLRAKLRSAVKAIPRDDGCPNWAAIPNRSEVDTDRPIDNEG